MFNLNLVIEYPPKYVGERYEYVPHEASADDKEGYRYQYTEEYLRKSVFSHRHSQPSLINSSTIRTQPPSFHEQPSCS